MNNYKLTIAYDGSDYYGYQRQDKYITVQETMESSLKKLFKQNIKINGSGRTDTGVHAMGQVINFKSEVDIPLDKMKFALNNILPGNIRVQEIELANMNFHARYSATSKYYRYKIIYADNHSPFLQKYAWQIDRPLDLESMQCVTQLIIGEHDFASFRSTGSKEGSAVRIIYNATWSVSEYPDINFTNCIAKSYDFEIHGNGFLYHMVRNLVGVIVQVGMGRMAIAEFQQLFADRRRTSKCVIAPPQGLYLNRVEY